jgi:glutaredoxin-related protein
MEHLMWLGINLEKNTVNLHSVDATSILPFIRGRDFQIVEIMGYKDNIEKNLLRENEERFWVRKNHYIAISGLIEDDNFENIHYLIIHFENGDGLSFSFGQLNVKLKDNKLLKKCTIKLLEQYGYFAAEKIWEFVSKQDCDMPIYYVLGMEEKDLGNSLNEMREKGELISSNFHS